MPHEWRSEDNSGELVLSFYHMGPENQTLIDIFGSKHFDLLKHLTSLAFVSFEY